MTFLFWDMLSLSIWGENLKIKTRSGDCNGDVKTVAVMEILAGTDV
jgi:hypothetical protein